MLHALVDYGQKVNIVGEAGFTSKTIRWLINFNDHGEYVGILSLSGPDDKRNKGREFHRVPHLKFSGDTPMRQFLVDTAQYVLLFGEDNPDRKLKNKHEYFINLLREASAAEPFLSKIANALSDSKVREIISNDLQQQTPKAKASDNVTFALISDAGAKLWVEDNSWHDWWRGHFPTLFKQKKRAESSMRCFISGELVEPAQTHPKIKLLGDVGGNVETTLVGFNKEAFCSYGLEQSQNAAISSDMAEQYAAVLNHLLSNNSKRLVGTKVVYWYTGDVKPEDDPMMSLFGDEAFGEAIADDEQTEEIHTSKRDRLQAENRVSDLLDAIRTGKRPDLKQARYCALTLSGNAGRVVVLDWMEGGFENLVQNINNWFDTLTIQKVKADKDDYLDVTKSPGIENIITCLLPFRKQGQKYDDWIKPIGVQRRSLWYCAVRQTSSRLLEGVIPLILLQLRSSMLKREISEAIDVATKGYSNRLTEIWCCRAAILKTYCISLGDSDMSVYLNEEHPNPAYHCGRLIATCQHIQSISIGEPKASMLDRFYASASSSPALVIPRIWRTSLHHLKNIRGRNEALSDDLWKLLREIHSKLKDNMPQMLSLYEQSLFQLGFFQQQAFLPSEAKTRSKRYQSKTGVMMRSKSEVIIANLLDDMRLKWFYEKDLEIEGVLVPNVLPDFTIDRGNNKTPLFIEHLGMLDRSSYKERWERKAEIYTQLGINLHDKGEGSNGILIASIEKDIEDLSSLRQRIQSIL